MSTDQVSAESSEPSEFRCRVCSSPSRGGSAPASRWRSRRWRGWCARFEPPVYCYHEIVHNKLVVERFERSGRGVRRRHRRRADRAARSCCRPTARRPRSSRPPAAAGSYVVDSVCPLVTKVHHEVKVRAGKGFRIVYVGHEGHEEAVGTMAVAPDSIHRVESVAEVDALPRSTSRSRCSPRPRCRTATGRASPCAVKERFPDVWTPGRSDLCFATTNRQSALMAHGRPLRRDRRDRLGQLVEHPGAREAGPRGRAAHGSFRINPSTSCPTTSPGIVGVTAGASAPEELVEEVIALLAPRSTASRWSASPTRTSTSRRRATSATCRRRSRPPSTVMLGGSLLDRPGMDDRSARRQRRARRPDRPDVQLR